MWTLRVYSFVLCSSFCFLPCPAPRACTADEFPASRQGRFSYSQESAYWPIGRRRIADDCSVYICMRALTFWALCERFQKAMRSSAPERVDDRDDRRIMVKISQPTMRQADIRQRKRHLFAKLLVSPTCQLSCFFCAPLPLFMSVYKGGLTDFDGYASLSF